MYYNEWLHSACTGCIQAPMDESPKCSKWYIHPSVIMRICAYADHRWGFESNSFLAILNYATSGFSLPMPVQPKHEISYS